MRFFKLLKSAICIRTNIVFSITEAVPHELFDVVFNNVSKQNLQDIVDFRGKKYQLIFDKFLDEGERGLYGYYKGKCVVHGWVVYNNSQFKSKMVCGYFKLPPKSCLIHFCNVADAFRGKGIYKAMLYQLYTRLCQGYKICIDTGINNTPAMKAIKASGGTYEYKLKNIYFGRYCIFSFKLK